MAASSEVMMRSESAAPAELPGGLATQREGATAAATAFTSHRVVNVVPNSGHSQRKLL